MSSQLPMGKRLGRALRGRRRLRAGIVQLIYVLAAFALGLVVPRIPVGFTVASGRAIDSLLAVGAGIVTFIGIVYSLLFLVVQFGSTTFTPRLNLFRDSPIVWHAFVYLEELRAGGATPIPDAELSTNRTRSFGPVSLSCSR